MNSTTQNKRLLSIDLARGLAVFFMISIHTLEVFADQQVKSSLFGEIIAFLGGPPSAPVFMTLMGFSFVYSQKSGLKPKLLRGFKIFLLGYVLNLFRGVIPFTLYSYYKKDIALILPMEKLDALTIFTMVDILQFAGIALMIMSVIQEIRLSKYLILFLSIFIGMISPFLWGFNLNFPLISQILELFVGDQYLGISFIENKIAFPVFPWLSFPLLGMFLGYEMRTTNDQNCVFKQFGVCGILIILIGFYISYDDLEYHFNDYYHSRQGAMLITGGFVTAWIYITKLAIDILPENRAFGLLFRWSKGVTNIYFTQWIVIVWSISFLGINTCSYASVILLIITFAFLSHLINEFIIYIRNNKNVGHFDQH